MSLSTKIIKSTDVPTDGNCEIHALVIILRNEQINIDFQDIKRILKPQYGWFSRSSKSF